MGRAAWWSSFAGALGATVLGAAGAAWGCVPQPLVTLLPLGSGSPGTELTVSATNISGDGEIRWNALDGPLLAKTTGDHVMTQVEVPEAEPGLYTVVVLQRAKDGSVGLTGRASFLVTEPGSEAENRSGGGEASAPPSLAEPPLDPSPDDGVDPLVTAVGGAGLVALGALGGAAISRRRPTAPS